MRVAVRIVQDELSPVLRRAQREIPNLAQTAADLWAATTQRIAREQIQAHTSTGRTYKRRSIAHTASAPGSYPNTDTGGLVSSILVNRGRGWAEVGSAKIGAGKKYGLFLEVGTRYMAARPWLRRSLDAAQPRSQRELEAAVERMLRP